MEDNTVTLDRNKIYHIGAIKGVILTMVRDKKEIKSWEIYKTIKRNNRLFCYDYYGDRVVMDFNSKKQTQKTKDKFSEFLRRENER